MKFFVSLMSLVFAGPLLACCMVPANYSGDVDQSKQEVVVIHRAPTDDAAGYQEMLIRVSPYFDESEQTPEYMAWVLTVPNKPDLYDFADETALSAGANRFDDVYDMARQQWADRTQFMWPEALTWMLPGRLAVDGKADNSLEIDETFRVGPYVITPIRAVGGDAVSALNAYLDERGFPQEDPDHLAYFVENDFTFLCIQFKPPGDDSRLGKRLEMSPLVLGFETDEPYYPGMFSSQQGNFGLDLTLITDTPIATRSLDKQRAKLAASRRGYVHLMNLWSIKPLPQELLNVVSDRASAQPDRWYYNRIESPGFNHVGEEDKPKISDWEEDVFFKVGDTRDAVAGFWYYGDTEISFVEKFFREHALALMVSVGLSGFLLLFVRVRKNRREFLASQAADKDA